MKYRDVAFLLLGGCFVVVGIVTANLIVTAAMADADISTTPNHKTTSQL